MASIYYLNNQPNPIWDYMTTALEDHPFFAPRGHHPHPHHPHPHQHHRGPFWGWDAQPQPDTARDSETNQPRGQESEPTPGPSAEQENRDAEKEAASTESDTDAFSHHSRGGKCKNKGHGGPHGLGKGRGGKGRHGAGHHHRAFHGPPPPPGFGPGHHGPFGHPFWSAGAGRGRGPHPRGCRGGRGKHHGGPPPFNAGPSGPGFDFLRGLAEQFGFPINNEQTREGADFVPPVDVFDTPTQYIAHISLPGAKKSDLSIDYDAEESVLRLAGVIYRPGMTEDLHEALAIEERSREVGVFEREIRFGTQKAPADVSVDEISARLEEGVLVVTLPKIVRQPEPKKKVVVEDGDRTSFNEKTPAYTSERASVTLTPTESEDESEEEEGEAKEYVKIPVQ